MIVIVYREFVEKKYGGLSVATFDGAQEAGPRLDELMDGGAKIEHVIEGVEVLLLKEMTPSYIVNYDAHTAVED